jgi:hypothetical protein
MTQYPAPICYRCKWFDGSDVWTCKAYPEGIPDEIIFSGVDHRKPYKGDYGTYFEPSDPEDYEKNVKELFDWRFKKMVKKG